ncbi:MAG: hypothetical protein JWO82_4049 [Akkermansiaceae bacterium]|nr:hypothetical protein [Akkermansiaceae bacterium]
MKALLTLVFLPVLAMAADPAATVMQQQQKEADLAAKISEHQTASKELSDKQDDLAADVQQLTIEQTSEEVAKMLKEVENAMDDASERLLDHDTGNDTIAAQTDVIEKIHDAAKKRQQQSGKGDASGAMMDMMERMMGKEPGEKPGEQKGKPGDTGGQGQTGDSDSANTPDHGPVTGGKEEQRRVPKASGTAGHTLPQEFQGALDAYNRAAGKISK